MMIRFARMILLHAAVLAMCCLCVVSFPQIHLLAAHLGGSALRGTASPSPLPFKQSCVTSPFSIALQAKLREGPSRSCTLHAELQREGTVTFETGKSFYRAHSKVIRYAVLDWMADRLACHNF
jgi:hypothetical protein